MRIGKSTRAAALCITFLMGAIAIFECWPESRTLNQSELVHESATTDPGTFESVGQIPLLFVAYAAKNGVQYGLSDHFIFRSDDGGQRFQRVGKIPEKYPSVLNYAKEIVARSKLVRLLRKGAGPRNLVVLDSGTVLVIGARGIFRSTDGGRSFSLVYDLAEGGYHSPMRSSVAVTLDDEVYFGEYVAGDSDHPISIMRGSNDGVDWQVAHTFEAGMIRHVHSVQYDPYRDRLWICTGDSSSESRLLYTADRFETVNVLGSGSQDWRIVSLVVTPEHLYWGSDNDTAEGASIFRWDFAADDLEELQYIGKPGYFSTALADGTLLITTAYEVESAYSEAANPEPTSDIWMSRNGDDWTKLISVPAIVKGPGEGFARSTITFPSGQALANLVYTLTDTQVGNLSTQVALLQPNATIQVTDAGRSAR